MSDDQPLWIVDQKSTYDYLLAVDGPDGIVHDLTTGLCSLLITWKATVKWDGCIDLRHIFNCTDWDDPKADEDTDYIHICELDEYIKRLQALREIAVKHFGEQWLDQ